MPYNADFKCYTKTYATQTITGVVTGVNHCQSQLKSRVYRWCN